MVSPWGRNETNALISRRAAELLPDGQSVVVLLRSRAHLTYGFWGWRTLHPFGNNSLVTLLQPDSPTTLSKGCRKSTTERCAWLTGGLRITAT
jgi:hypothetical protein